MVTSRRSKRSTARSNKEVTTTKKNDESLDGPQEGASKKNEQIETLVARMRQKEFSLKALNKLWCSQLRNVSFMVTVLVAHKFISRVSELKVENEWSKENFLKLSEVALQTKQEFLDVLVSLALIAVSSDRKYMKIRNKVFLGCTSLVLLLLVNNFFLDQKPSVSIGFVWYVIFTICLGYMEYSENVASRNIQLIVDIQNDLQLESEMQLKTK